MPYRLTKDASGFTLIEIVIVITVLGVLAIVAIPRLADVIAGSRETATRSEMRKLKISLVGSAHDGLRGYENDVGALPATLEGLATQPSGVPAWNRFTKTGWNGPYIDASDGDYLKDSWGADYIYDAGARVIHSIGSGDTITINF